MVVVSLFIFTVNWLIIQLQLPTVLDRTFSKELNQGLHLPVYFVFPWWRTWTKMKGGSLPRWKVCHSPFSGHFLRVCTSVSSTEWGSEPHPPVNTAFSPLPSQFQLHYLKSTKVQLGVEQSKVKVSSHYKVCFSSLGFLHFRISMSTYLQVATVQEYIKRK